MYQRNRSNTELGYLCIVQTVYHSNNPRTATDIIWFDIQYEQPYSMSDLLLWKTKVGKRWVYPSKDNYSEPKFQVVMVCITECLLGQCFYSILGSNQNHPKKFTITKVTVKLVHILVKTEVFL